MKPHIRLVPLVGFVILMLGVLGIKAADRGWFAIHPPLELNGQPALLFFTLSEGCDCQMLLVHNAEAQLAEWNLPTDLGLNVIRVDFTRRPDLAKQYGVVRAPALVLLGTAGQVTWKQDVGLSDATPLNLEQVGVQVDALFDN